MASENRIPDDPLDFIIQCVQSRKIFWTYHVNMRMHQRSIAREAILHSIASYTVIESYPDDKYLPSYLIYADYQGEPIHILFAIDTDTPNVRLITAYRPDPSEWDTTLRRRKQL